MKVVYKKFGLFLPIIGILILGVVGFTLAQIDTGPVEVTDPTPPAGFLPPEPPTLLPETVTPMSEVVVPNNLDSGGTVSDNDSVSPSVEAAPEFIIVKEVAERYIFAPQLTTGLPVVEVVDQGGTLQISGTCNDPYYVILMFRGAEDHIAEPSSYIVNRAYPCEGGTFSYSLTNDNSLPTNLDGTYHLFVGAQGETGAWRVVSPVIPVQIRKEVSEREIKVPVPRAQTLPPSAQLIPEVTTPAIPEPNESIIPPQTDSAPAGLELPLNDLVPPPELPLETLSEPQVDSVDDVAVETELLPPTPDENWQVFETELPPPPPSTEGDGGEEASPPVSIWRQWWQRLMAKWQPDILAFLWLK